MKLLLPYSCLTGILLTVILLIFNKGYKTANRYLAGFFLFTTLFVLSQYSGLYSDSQVLAAIIASAPTPFVFLIGPLSFLYIRGLLRDDTKLSRMDYFHFVPFMLQLIGMIPYYFSSWTYKMSVAATILSENWQVTHLSLNSLFPSPVNSYLRPLHLLIYVIAQWMMIVGYYKRRQVRGFISHQASVIRRWTYYFTGIYSVFLCCYGILTVLLFTYTTRSAFQQHSQLYLILASATILALNLACFLFPQILYGSPRIRWVEQESQPDAMTVKEEETTVHDRSIANSQNEAMQRVGKKLSQYLVNAQPWTHKKFSIATLSVALGLPEHHLRYYFNHHLNISFSTYRNRLKVEHAKTLLAGGAPESLSMEGIGTTAGFSSKSSFYAVFKELTGMTPGEYVQQLSKKH